MMRFARWAILTIATAMLLIYLQPAYWTATAMVVAPVSVGLAIEVFKEE